MSNRNLHRILAGIAIIWTLWLPVHRFLVVRYDANPWKGAGMAMYTNPHSFDLDIDFYADGTQMEVREGNFKLSTRRHISKFQAFRKHMGSMIKPDKLANKLLEESQADMLVLSVKVRRINPKTATLESERKTFTYTKD